MDNGNGATPRQAERWLSTETETSSPPRRLGERLRDLWLTIWRGRPEERYAKRTLRRMASGKLRDTLGLEVRDEAATRAKAERWLAQMIDLGLRPDHLCIEYGCGSLWCAEPFIRYLAPSRFVGLDVTDGFYALGRQRLGALLEQKKVQLDVISRNSLREAAVLRPDFVFSHRVLHHVPLRGLARYMRNICSLLDDRTILVIEHMPRPLRGQSIKAPRYEVAHLQPHLPSGWVCERRPFGFVITRRGAAEA
jgi:SAM-dependent methyltransferase